MELKKKIVDTLRSIQPDFDYGSLLKKINGKTPAKVNQSCNNTSVHEKALSQVKILNFETLKLLNGLFIFTFKIVVVCFFFGYGKLDSRDRYKYENR